MRILTGQYKGRALKRPPGIRLTSDKVKAAVFNIIHDAVVGAQFLDICAGSGSVGLEALSRGAAAVTWIERDSACVKVLRENVACIGGEASEAHLRVIHQPAPAAIRHLSEQGLTFDLLFLDPPYDDISLLKKTLQAMSHHAILADAGWLMVEHERHVPLPQPIENMALVKSFYYGDTVLTLCRRAESSDSG